MGLGEGFFGWFWQHFGNRPARPLTVAFSSILTVLSGLLLIRGSPLVVFRYVPLLPLLLALGIYEIVVALRFLSPPYGRA